MNIQDLQKRFASFRQGAYQRTREIPFAIVVLGALAVAIGVLYSPTWDANFQGDDYRYLQFLFFNLKALLDGQGWITFFSSAFGWNAWTYFRPVFQLSYLLDYLTWGLNPVGYHLSNLALHLETSFLVFVLFRQLARDRLAAAIAGLLFAIMPIHVEAVAWFGARADGLCALWYLFGVVFFVIYRQRGQRKFLAGSVIGFIMALLSKEASVTLPGVLLVYDLLSGPITRRVVRKSIPAHLPFWGVLAGYLGLRLALWGQMGSFAQSRIQDLNWDYLTQIYAQHFADPFFLDMTGDLRSILLGGAVLLLLLFSRRREVLFGAAWICITIVPSLLTQDYYIFDRYVYLPSVGLAIIVGSVLSRPLPRLRIGFRVVGMAACGILILVYARSLVTRNQEWARAAHITKVVTDQVLALHPTFPSNARLVFTNVPVLVGPRGMQAFGGKLPSAIQLTFANQGLQVSNFAKFPIWLGDTSQTFFFEYTRRGIAERTDLVRALEQRNQCEGQSFPRMQWLFLNDAEAWEPWSDLSELQVRDGALAMRSSGVDPVLASPPIDIPSVEIGSIQVTMRVRAERLRLQGAIYWLASEQQDFSPDLQIPFEVRGDGEFHTYSVNIGASNKLLFGDHISQLRLDPIDGPGQIDLKSILILVHCNQLKGETCGCLP